MWIVDGMRATLGTSYSNSQGLSDMLVACLQEQRSLTHPHNPQQNKNIDWKLQIPQRDDLTSQLHFSLQRHLLRLRITAFAQISLTLSTRILKRTNRLLLRTRTSTATAYQKQELKYSTQLLTGNAAVPRKTGRRKCAKFNRLDTSCPSF